jgi:hypothetical protein
MIQIRAGVLKNLKLNFDIIYKDVLKEIICKNGMKELIELYALIDLIERKGLFLSEVSIDPISPEFILGNYADLLLSFLLTRYSIEEVGLGLALYLDIGFIYDEELIRLDCWKNVRENIGFQKEEFVKTELAKIGIFIGSVNNKTKKFKYKGVEIKLNGRPDGIITSSYGDIYKKNTVVEIKFKKNLTAKNNSSKNDDIMQLVAYAILFNSDVIYIRVGHNDNIFIDTYSYDFLLDVWNSTSEEIFKNCVILHNLFKQAKTNEEGLKELFKMIKSD